MAAQKAQTRTEGIESQLIPELFVHVKRNDHLKHLLRPERHVNERGSTWMTADVYHLSQEIHRTLIFAFGAAHIDLVSFSMVIIPCLQPGSLHTCCTHCGGADWILNMIA